MDMYWWALVLGLIVLNVSILLGKKNGLLNSREDDTVNLADNQITKDKIAQDRDEEQLNNSAKGHTNH